MNWLARLIFFRLMGWKLEGSLPADLKKAVFIVVPHTSWHDFYMGLLVRRILDAKIQFLAKKELFKPPFGWYFKWMGGISLDRTAGQKKVDQIAKIFDQKEKLYLALSPEGTRKKVEEWKTGFYYIAKSANVPIVMVAFDFGKKLVRVSQPFSPSADKEQDFKTMKLFYKGVIGKKPAHT